MSIHVAAQHDRVLAFVHSHQRRKTMSVTYRDYEAFDRDSAHGSNANAQNDAMDDEEKILAGRIDVNMPALLTKDVQGG